jgi:carbonic anhydrase/acetyltransferase-like protein (isoleucine patch superfamily)
MSIVLPGVRIGCGALVGAHSSVSRDVRPDTVAAGAPAKEVCPTSDIKLRDGSGQPAYPWRRHFHRGYPDTMVENWLAEFGLGKASLTESHA